MIAARVGVDAFLVWSVPYARARSLVPGPLVPTRFEDRGWIACAAVELTRVRACGLPVPAAFSVAAWVAVVDLDAGRRGNYFLRAFSESRLVWSALSVAMATPVTRRAVHLGRNDCSMQVSIDGDLEATLDRTVSVSDADSLRLDALFARNRSGIGRGRRGIYESSVTKDHWRMIPHPVRVDRAPFADENQGRLEFAFDASEDRARWAWPRRID